MTDFSPTGRVVRESAQLVPNPCQFSLKVLLLVATVAAFYFALVRVTGWYIVVPACFLAGAWYVVKKCHDREIPVSWLLTVHAVWLTILAGYDWMYELGGGIAPAGCVFLGVPLTLLLGCTLSMPFPRLRHWTCLILVLLYVYFFVQSAVEWDRLAALRVEVRQIVSWAEKHRAQHGCVPETLAGYKFRSGLMEFIDYEAQDSCNYEVMFHPSRPFDISHYYRSQDKKWGFYDD